jgi:dihydrodipicolinate synthase/N-acetylneuraminate lyase
MAGEANDLERRVEELHRALASAERVDPATLKALDALLGDIDRLRARPRTGVASPAGDETHADRLTEAAQRFQADHPTLAGTLEGLADALSRMGI